MLNQYRTPVLLTECSLQLLPSSTGNESDDFSFGLLTESYVTQLKAVSINAKTMWTKKLEAAIRNSKEKSQKFKPSESPVPQVVQSGIGRFLLEIVCVRNLEFAIPADCRELPVVLRLDFGDFQTKKSSVDLMKTDALLTTQFVITSKTQIFRLGFYLEKLLAPNQCIGFLERPLDQLITSGGFRRGPSVQQLPLASEFSPPDRQAMVILKFDVQLFEN